MSQTSMVKRLDKLGHIWVIYQKDWNWMLQWRAQPHRQPGKFQATVFTADSDLKRLPLAKLTDIVVMPELRNRGLGSILLREIIAACKKLGHSGIEGVLSDVDSNHFDLLKHFYEKFGFTVTIFPAERPERESRWAGRVELLF